VTPREAVQVRPAEGGTVLVETPGGQRGYAPAEPFGTRGAVATGPARVSATPASVSSNTGDVRSLAASNIARRDNFNESLSNAQAAVDRGGFELAT
jgi:hypothetical protein